jgi:hypothetical protein
LLGLAELRMITRVCFILWLRYVSAPLGDPVRDVRVDGDRPAEAHGYGTTFTGPHGLVRGAGFGVLWLMSSHHSRSKRDRRPPTSSVRD